MLAPEVVVIDYGLGNLLSVKRGLEQSGARVLITDNPKTLLGAKKVVLPGVGAFSNAIQSLEKTGMSSVIKELASQNVPILGICLGMQLFFDKSDEFGVTSGLGLIPGGVIAIPNISKSGIRRKIPHIGWSQINLPSSVSNWEGTLLQDLRVGDAVYFVHSFMANPRHSSDHLANCIYEDCSIPAVVKRGSVIGCQFHPEKSGQVGLSILRRFCFD